MRSISPRSPMVASRDGLPLTGVFNGTRLADDGDLDLSGVFQLVLDPPGDVLGQPDGLLVRDVIALDQDADLAAGLQRKRLRDALERVGDAFELFQPLDVGLEDVAARAWPGGGDR